MTTESSENLHERDPLVIVNNKEAKKAFRLSQARTTRLTDR